MDSRFLAEMRSCVGKLENYLAENHRFPELSEGLRSLEPLCGKNKQYFLTTDCIPSETHPRAGTPYSETCNFTVEWWRGEWFDSYDSNTTTYTLESSTKPSTWYLGALLYTLVGLSIVFGPQLLGALFRTIVPKAISSWSSTRRLR